MSKAQGCEINTLKLGCSPSACQRSVEAAACVCPLVVMTGNCNTGDNQKRTDGGRRCGWFLSVRDKRKSLKLFWTLSLRVMTSGLSCKIVILYAGPQVKKQNPKSLYVIFMSMELERCGCLPCKGLLKRYSTVSSIMGNAGSSVFELLRILAALSQDICCGHLAFPFFKIYVILNCWGYCLCGLNVTLEWSLLPSWDG